MSHVVHFSQLRQVGLVCVVEFGTFVFSTFVRTKISKLLAHAQTSLAHLALAHLSCHGRERGSGVSSDSIAARGVGRDM